MENVINTLISFILMYIYVLIFILIFGYIIPKVRKRLTYNKGAQYIIKTYKLKNDNKTVDKVCLRLVFINALIITPAILFFWHIKLQYIWTVIILLIYFTPALFGLYSLLGMILKKKGW